MEDQKEDEPTAKRQCREVPPDTAATSPAPVADDILTSRAVPVVSIVPTIPPAPIADNTLTPRAAPVVSVAPTIPPAPVAYADVASPRTPAPASIEVIPAVSAAPTTLRKSRSTETLISNRSSLAKPTISSIQTPVAVPSFPRINLSINPDMQFDPEDVSPHSTYHPEYQLSEYTYNREARRKQCESFNPYRRKNTYAQIQKSLLANTSMNPEPIQVSALPQTPIATNPEKPPLPTELDQISQQMKKTVEFWPAPTTAEEKDQEHSHLVDCLLTLSFKDGDELIRDRKMSRGMR